MAATNPASTKQINYLRNLIRQTGCGDVRLGSWCKPFGLTTQERQGTLDTLSAKAAYKLIVGLREMQQAQWRKDHPWQPGTASGIAGWRHLNRESFTTRKGQQ